MPHCIKESDFNPDIHVKVSGPYTLEECQQNCGQSVGGLAIPGEKKDCGCRG